MTSCIALMLAAPAAGAAAEGAAQAPFRAARFFVDGSRNPGLLGLVRKGTDKAISFAGHYSSAYVSCGPGCDSYWYVDRRTGSVVEVPQSPVEAAMIWDVAARRDSDRLRVTYGPRDGIPTRCFARSYRLVGTRFVALDRRSAVRCP